MAPSPYEGQLVLVASRHDKAAVMARPLAKLLGVQVASPPDLDTDQFGTFSGDVARPGPPIEMLRAKIALCRQAQANRIVIASEGAYSPHPYYAGLAVAHEWIMWDDSETGFNLVESKRTITPHYYATSLQDAAQLDGILQRCGWPKLAVTVHAHDMGLPSFKGLNQYEEISKAIQALSEVGAKNIVIATDMRAHLHPPRQRSIAHLAARLARRIRTACPQCHQYGFGKRHQELGLSCMDCGCPTHQIKAKGQLCEHCGYTKTTWRAQGRADPYHCDYCNP